MRLLDLVYSIAITIVAFIVGAFETFGGFIVSTFEIIKGMGKRR